MGEKLGFMTVLLLIAVGIVPFMLNMFDEHVKTSKLLSLSNEMQQLVSAEGDITPKVTHAVNELEEKGVEVEFKDQNGNIITSSPGIGEKVIIEYRYDGYGLSNSVVLNKR